MKSQDNTLPNNVVIIVAAGRGSRMGNSADGPKQYRMLGDASILQHTINAFLASPLIRFIQVVIHHDDIELYEKSVLRHSKLLDPIFGGATRQQSVFAGLKAISEYDLEKVLIHDAARPFVSVETIGVLLAEIQRTRCVIPAAAISETIKRAKKTDQALQVTDTVSRDDLYLAQTPQCFYFDEIISAHQSAAVENRHDFTDDAAVGEHYGMSVWLVAGSRDNIKITTIEDLEYANKMNGLNIKSQVPDIRTGNGYDVHRLVDGKAVILCGLEIPFSKKLDGHSDADVGLHAITDALLGAIADGDIGSHFPPSDPQWRGAASDQFLQHTCKLVQDRNGVITHIDVTLICELPKIGPHRDKMRARLAEICNIDIGSISVKATTNETIGSIGRGEGIAAIANATVVIQA
jgi:2-C-methyl-D-erythritol 4-phosphate cytidylyltransferase/2-C-methyl-D-erythritol 2,4-cyclodiphosphate synthase